jgi:hypothetical protein
MPFKRRPWNAPRGAAPRAGAGAGAAARELAPELEAPSAVPAAMGGPAAPPAASEVAPAEPVARAALAGAFLGLFREVPALADALAPVDVPDARGGGGHCVRVAALAARDVASFTIALGLRGKLPTPLWRSLAAQCGAPAAGAAASVAPVRAAVAEQAPARAQLLEVNFARGSSQLTDADMAAMPRSRGRVTLAAVQAAAHRRHGDAAGLMAVHAARKRAEAARLSPGDVQAERREDSIDLMVERPFFWKPDGEIAGRMVNRGLQDLRVRTYIKRGEIAPHVRRPGRCRTSSTC